MGREAAGTIMPHIAGASGPSTGQRSSARVTRFPTLQGLAAATCASPVLDQHGGSLPVAAEEGDGRDALSQEPAKAVALELGQHHLSRALISRRHVVHSPDGGKGCC